LITSILQIHKFFTTFEEYCATRRRINNCSASESEHYADDFVVTAANRETLEKIKILLTGFLAQHG
jgi:hypothetical protein